MPEYYIIVLLLCCYYYWYSWYNRSLTYAYYYNFASYTVIQRVLAKKHEKLGPDVSIRECSVLDSFEVSSDNDYESAEEEEEVVVKEKPSNKRGNKTGEKSSQELIKSKRRTSRIG